MKKLLLSALLLCSTTTMAEGVFLGGGILNPDFSLDCQGALQCGQVSAQFTLEPGAQPINTLLELDSEPFFVPSFFGEQGFFFDTFLSSIGVAYLDRDAIASQYNTAGFYLLTRSFEGTLLPDESDVTLSNVVFDYDAATATASVSFDWSTDVNVFTINQQWGLMVNQDAGLAPHLSDWDVDQNLARITVQALDGAVDRMDVHAIINGEEFNFAMTETYLNFWAWDMPPNIPDNADIEVFFNYDVNGVGIDTPIFTDNVGDLGELFTVQINSFNDTFSLTDQAIFILPGELGFDPIKLTQAFVSYRVNGGQLFAFEMQRVTTRDDGFSLVTAMQHTFPFDLQSGDEIEYNLTYTYKGVPYTEGPVTFTVF